MSQPKLFNQNFSVEEQYEILSSGVVDLINKEEFLKKLKTKKALKVKAGFDPSRPDLHLGHSLLINKLRQFQELGHEVIFVVGDFTACIGDPSGQNKTRPVLSFEESQKNALSYKEQATKNNFEVSKKLEKGSKKIFEFFKRLDSKKTKLLYNSEWLSKISLQDFILSICSKRTIARQLERRDFKTRYKANEDIGLHELFYPLLQAYDSKELKADIEIGGTDQLFNLLLGRELQEKFGQSPQVVLTLPLLEGLDAKSISPDNWNMEGTQKMSKSLNNAICFNDSAKDMYGKTMSISDQLLIKWWKVFTEGNMNLADFFKKENINPKLKKEELAWLLVCSFYGEEIANEEQDKWTKQFSKKELPDDIPEYQDFLNPELNKETTLLKKEIELLQKEKHLLEREIGIAQLLKELGLAGSTSEARRKILEGAVKQEEQKITDPHKKITIKKGAEILFRMGKRKFKRVNTKWNWLHDLKAYLVYRKIKYRGENQTGLCEELAEDQQFKNYISLSSIKMKIENYRYLDTGKGLSAYSNQSHEVFNKYKNQTIQEIETEIKKMEKNKHKGDS